MSIFRPVKKFDVALQPNYFVGNCILERQMKTVYLPTRKKWHQWLEQNFDSEKEIWLIFYKIHTIIASISYDDAGRKAGNEIGWIGLTIYYFHLTFLR